MSGVLWHLETLIYNLLYSQWHCFSYHFCLLGKQSNINCNDQANNLTYELPLSFFFLHNNTQPWSSFSWASGYPLSRYIYQITLHFWHTFKQFSDHLGIVVWHITGKANSPTMHMAFCFFFPLILVFTLLSCFFFLSFYISHQQVPLQLQLSAEILSPHHCQDFKYQIVSFTGVGNEVSFSLLWILGFFFFKLNQLY